MRQVAVLILMVLPWLTGCATTHTHAVPSQTQLQIREFQTRSFETADAKLVMKAMLNVLQDEGFIVKDANVDLGFMTGSKEMDIEDKGKAFMSRIFWGKNARWEKNSVVEVTANVSEMADRTRVRVIFQVKILNNVGVVSKIQQVDDETYYQEFFAKVDKSIFIEKEKL